MGSVLFILIVIAAFSAFSYVLFYKLRLLGHLKAENRFDDIANRVRSVFYLGFFQRKMIRGEPKPGTMHALIFWGFMIILFRKLQLFAIAFDEFFDYPGMFGSAFSVIKDVASLIVLLAVTYALYRRLISKPARLKNSHEALFILAMIFTIMLTDFLYDAFKFALYSDTIESVKHEKHFAFISSVISDFVKSLSNSTFTLDQHLSSFLGFGYVAFYWIQIIVVFAFLVFIPQSEHLHVVTGLPALYFRNLDRPHSATSKVPTIDLEKVMNAENDEDSKVGINTIKDLTWKEAYDLYTCTECGRCKDSCPTWITDKPLAMQWVNEDLRNHLVENGSKVAGELENTDLMRLVGNVIKEDTLWACTTCGYCEAACPIELEHLPRIYKMRQNMVMMETEFPEALVKVFNNYEGQSNPWGVPANTRGDWAKAHDVTYITSSEQMAEMDYLYYVGSAQSFDSRNQKVAVSMVKILKNAGVKFGILGKEELSTGECVRRVGNEMLFQQMAGSLIEVLNNKRVTRIVTCDPHAYNTLKNEYKEFGGRYDIIHHSELLNTLLETQKIKVSKSFDKVIYHDPCYLGRHNGVFEQPRNVIKAVSNDKPIEFKMNREKAMCCGAGGGRMWLEETIGTRINEKRVDQALEEELKIIATGCPYCLIMMEEAVGNKGIKEKVQAKDIAELVAEALI
jgi:Fe-S oxidoreductase